MEIIILKNGLKILFYPMPNTHSVTMGLYIKAGCGYEQRDFVGATHFLEHLHFRKCGVFSQEELYYKMERMGSTLRAITYRDFLQFSMRVRPNYVDECVEIFKNILASSDWSDEEFDKEKRVVINQILENGNYITLEREMRELLFGQHSLNNEIMGNVDVVESLSKIELQEYKKDIFSAHNMMLCVTGNINENKQKSILEHLKSIPITQCYTERVLSCPDRFYHRKPDVLLRHVQDDNPLEVNLSFDVAYEKESKDYLTILNCILGEGVGSRLQKIVREEKGYSSDIASYMEWYSNFAVLHIRFTVEKKNLLDCLKDIVTTINEMKCEISNKDLDVSLPFYTSNYEFLEDDTEEMNFQLAYNEFVLGTDCHVMNLENTSETIINLQKVAEQVFMKNNMSLVVIGNTNKITKKLIREILDEI